MSTNPFLKQNKKAEKPIEIFVSENFIDEKDNPIPFVLKIISSEEADLISETCMEPVIDPQTRRKIGQEINQKRFQMELLVKSIVEPDLEDEELQKSYGAHNAFDCLQKMLNFKEKANLIRTFDKEFESSEQKSENSETETKNE